MRIVLLQLLEASKHLAAAACLLLLALLGLGGLGLGLWGGARCASDHKALTRHVSHSMALLRGNVTLWMCRDDKAGGDCFAWCKPLPLGMIQAIHHRIPTIGCSNWNGVGRWRIHHWSTRSTLHHICPWIHGVGWCGIGIYLRTISHDILDGSSVCWVRVGCHDSASAMIDVCHPKGLNRFERLRIICIMKSHQSHQS